MDTEGETIREEELLAQLGWVRALARSLVLDAGMADDVLQQVCLLALEKAPRGARTGPSLRAWLAAVTRSLARRSARSHVRRLARERAAAQAEALPSTIEIAAHREALNALVHAVTDLEEPYFSTLVERYFQGDSVAEIAARQRTTAAAVRQRLVRAKGQLRARLGRLLAEDRSGHLRALLPLGLPVATLAPLHGRSVLEHIGGTLMAQKAGASGIVKLAASLLIVAGLCFVAWRGLRVDDPIEGAVAKLAPVEAAPSAPAMLLPLAVPAAPEPTPLLAHRAEDALARLVGRVTLRDTGAPAEGLRVQAEFTSSAVAPEYTRDVTDADGRYSFSLLEPCAVTSITVLPGAQTRGVTRAIDLQLAPDAEAVQDLQVARAATLSGRVVDGDGRSVPGARVRAWNVPSNALDERPDAAPDRESAADARGQFSIGGLGPACVLVADAPGLTGSARLAGDLAEGALADGLLLELGPVRELAGMVLGPDDVPVRDAVLHATAEEPPAPLTGVPGVFRIAPPDAATRSGAEGRFTLPGLADVAYVLRASSDRHVAWSGRHAPGDPDLIIRLEAGTTLQGEVLSARGAPVPGAGVTVCRLADAWPVPLRPVLTDAGGRFEAPGLDADDRFAILVRAEGHALHVEQPVMLGERGSAFVTIELTDALALAGTVVNEHDQPIAGASVGIQGDRLLPLKAGLTVHALPTWEALFAGANAAVTDAQGRFRFEQLYDGRFELAVASPEGSGTVAVLQARAGDESLRIVVDGSRTVGVTLLGSVRDALTGLPVESFRITPMIPQGSGMSGDDHAFDGPAGTFRVTGLQPGEIATRVSSPGYATLSLPATEYDAGEHRLDLQLFAERALSLRVVDADHEPVSAKLTCTDETGAPLFTKDSQNRSVSPRTTDDNGEAILMGLPAARIKLQVKQGWFGSSEEFSFDLRHELRGIQVLVLGDESSATVLVFYVAASVPLSIDPAAQGLLPAMELLQKQIEAGVVMPVEAPIEVRARTPDGRVVAQESVDPKAAPRNDATPLPGFAGACNLRLTVPRQPLEFEVSGAGYETARCAWQPDRADGAADVVVLVLRKT
jgi:RNA polymerase sigma factor (sigma-70 family)